MESLNQFHAEKGGTKIISSYLVTSSWFKISIDAKLQQYLSTIKHFLQAFYT